MDLLGSILSTLEKPPSTTNNKNKQMLKTEESSNIKEENNQFSDRTYSSPLSLEKYKIFCATPSGESVKVQPVKTLSDDRKPRISNDTPKHGHKCEICGKLYTDYKMFRSHLKNHKRNKLSGKHPFKKTSTEKEVNKKKVNMPTNFRLIEATTIKKEDNLYVPAAQQSITQSVKQEYPCEFEVNKETDIIPECSAKMETNVKESVNQGCYLFDSATSSEVNSQIKKQSYVCNICDRVFTKRKTYLNHKTNHNYNRNTGKFLFHKRGKGKSNE